MKIRIGFEIHIELNTKSKMFCSCENQYGGEPNTRVCEICTGNPGALPSPNREAIKKAIQIALALNSKINSTSLFARKNYFYPDLPKGYQITQYQIPFALDGYIEIEGKKIPVERINLEEETAKSLYTDDGNVLLDFNRCGIPLLEVVTLPEIQSPREGYKFLVHLKRIAQYLNISECDMEKGMLRVDSNVSVSTAKIHQHRTELKNLNSFKAVQEALLYEIKRQEEAIKRGKVLIQETRLWDEFKRETRVMRTKEEAHDYRYFPEPDLPPLFISGEWISKIKEEMPELPDKKKKRFQEIHKLSDYETEILTDTIELSDYFERVLQNYKDAKNISNWIMNEVLSFTNSEDIKNFIVSPENLGKLLRMIDEGKITRNIGKDILAQMVKTGEPPELIVQKKGIEVIKGKEKLQEIVLDVIRENPEPVRKYKNGKKGPLSFLIGQVMKKTKGQADARETKKILKEQLEGE